MDRASLLELLADGPVIAAVKDDAGLEAALKSDVAVLFLLYGDILTIGETIARIHQAGKRAFVHLDLIDGLSAREISRKGRRMPSRSGGMPQRPRMPAPRTRFSSTVSALSSALWAVRTASKPSRTAVSCKKA